MQNEIKSKILEFVYSLGIPAAGISGDNKSYSNIVCLFPYNTGLDSNANLSRYVYARDYHVICTKYLEKILLFIQKLVPDVKTEIHVDKGEGDDKKEAYLAGLGFWGENSLLIHPVYGSFTFIGYIKTDLIFPSDTPLSQTCLKCEKCMDACPGGAIHHGKIIIEKCASYLSQKKGTLTSKEERIVKKTSLIWGCDICQTVCPHNQTIPQSPLSDFHESQIRRITSFSMSNSSFKMLYGDRAFSWRGKNVLKRNLEIISLNDSQIEG